jgi:hypothetical protein
MRVFVTALFCLALCVRPALAQEIEVDVELVLAVDISRSMNPVELEIQRKGYAAALTSPAVVSAIRGGMLGRIALTYVEWAGSQHQQEIVPWTLIESQADAERVAAMILAHQTYGARRTSISSALVYGAAAIESNAFRGLRRVIDVSGDGPNNQGPQVDLVRDEVVARGIIINGIPLMTRDALSSRFSIDELDLYYAACVIGGPGAFVIPVREWPEFANAVRQKLVLEIAGLPLQLVPAAAAFPPSPTDCQIGEKLWETYRPLDGYDF